MAEIVARGLVVDRVGDATRGGRVRALDGVDLTIERGELVAVMGGTGAGKSTLALALAGLVEPSAGSVDGAARGRVRVVLQRPEASFLADRVIDEVMLAPLARGEPAAAATRHAAQWLAALGLPEDVAQRDPLALSGGEQRRVAIAATLASDAAVLVLDEPGAGLDRAARRHLHHAIASLHAAGRTIVVVTHDPDEAATLATRLVVLRGGRVVWDGGVDPVLGDPQRAAGLGLRTAPEVEVLHAVARSRGIQVSRAPARASEAIRELARVVEAPAVAAQPAAGDAVAAGAAASAAPERAPLPPLVDARLRVLATGLVLVAALAARSLLAAGIVLAACIAATAAARIERTRLRVAVRPLVMLAVLLVLLQLVVGGAPGVAPALLRAMQAAGVVLATLVLSARTTTLDLATALRRLLAPLRLLAVPVATLAFVVATGIGLVPAMSDELERLRLAQRARGLRAAAHRAGIARLRADAALAAPLFAAAFRRAHLLADALAVRAIDPRRGLPAWRAQVVPAKDAALLVAGAALVAVARFA